MSAVPSTPQRSTAPSLAQQFLQSLQSESLPGGTPVKSNSSQYAYDQARPLSIDDRRFLLAKAMNGYTIGNLKYEDFLTAFVPEAPTPTPKVQYRLGPLATEAAMYDPLLRGVNRVLNNHFLVNTSAHPDRVDGVKPDGLVYPANLGSYVDLHGCRTRLDEALLGLEDKLELDIFDDEAAVGGFEPKLTDKESNAVGQVLTYIERMHCRQNRTFSFFLFINAEYFRIIRTDRDGMVVTQKRLWKKKQDKYQCLNEFLHRFDNLTGEDQGKDTSVRRVPKERAHLEEPAKAALAPYLEDLKKRKPLALDAPILEVDVPIDQDAKSGWRQFYVWAPVIEPHGIRTRATVGYPAWDPVQDKVFFLKDSWRSGFANVQPEAEIIRGLNDAGVSYVPQLICGGDLPGKWQKTVTHEYVGYPKNKGQHKEHHPRIHHRLVEPIYEPLWKFKSSKQLLQILDNVCTGHRMAVEKCYKLHRDFSFRNIMWDEKNKCGVLIDWDLCAPTPSPADMAQDPTLNPLAQLPSQSGRPDRTGTWLFMSSSLLMTPGKLHTVQDDLESLFWVALYVILLYFPFGDLDVVDIIDNIFYEIREMTFAGDKQVAGGSQKDVFLEGKGFAATFRLPDSISTPLIAWFRMYRGMLKDWVHHSATLADLRKDLHEFETGAAVDMMCEAESIRETIARMELAQPDLRDYGKLQHRWRLITQSGEAQGLFKDNDRLTDDDHQHSPEHVLKLYRARRAATSRQEQLDRASANQQAIAARSQDSGSQSGQGVRRKRDDDEPQAGSSRGTTLLGSGQSDVMGEGDTEDEAARRRPTKRPRKPTQSGSGADGKGKGRRTRG
ncbi:hypothetical protein EV714DRAFT_274062 [Schizophyllum commune]